MPLFGFPLLADIAHELRTPVSNLMTHTEVVLTKKRNIDAYEENLYSNLEELKRMSRIIDDMLFWPNPTTA